jgi:hypothetical protein
MGQKLTDMIPAVSKCKTYANVLILKNIRTKEDTAFFMKGGYYMVNQKRVISE